MSIILNSNILHQPHLLYSFSLKELTTVNQSGTDYINVNLSDTLNFFSDHSFEIVSEIVKRLFKDYKQVEEHENKVDNMLEEENIGGIIQPLVFFEQKTVKKENEKKLKDSDEIDSPEANEKSLNYEEFYGQVQSSLEIREVLDIKKFDECEENLNHLEKTFGFKVITSIFVGEIKIFVNIEIEGVDVEGELMIDNSEFYGSRRALCDEKIENIQEKSILNYQTVDITEDTNKECEENLKNNKTPVILCIDGTSKSNEHIEEISEHFQVIVMVKEIHNESEENIENYKAIDCIQGVEKKLELNIELQKDINDDELRFYQKEKQIKLDDACYINESGEIKADTNEESKSNTEPYPETNLIPLKLPEIKPDIVENNEYITEDPIKYFESIESFSEIKDHETNAEPLKEDIKKNLETAIVKEIYIYNENPQIDAKILQESCEEGLKSEISPLVTENLKEDTGIKIYYQIVDDPQNNERSSGAGTTEENIVSKINKEMNEETKNDSEFSLEYNNKLLETEKTRENNECEQIKDSNEESSEKCFTAEEKKEDIEIKFEVADENLKVDENNKKDILQDEEEKFDTEFPQENKNKFLETETPKKNNECEQIKDSIEENGENCFTADECKEKDIEIKLEVADENLKIEDNKKDIVQDEEEKFDTEFPQEHNNKFLETETPKENDECEQIKGSIEESGEKCFTADECKEEDIEKLPEVADENLKVEENNKNDIVQDEEEKFDTEFPQEHKNKLLETETPKENNECEQIKDSIKESGENCFNADECKEEDFVKTLEVSDENLKIEDNKKDIVRDEEAKIDSEFPQGNNSKFLETEAPRENDEYEQIKNSDEETKIYVNLIEESCQNCFIMNEKQEDIEKTFEVGDENLKIEENHKKVIEQDEENNKSIVLYKENNTKELTIVDTIKVEIEICDEKKHDLNKSIENNTVNFTFIEGAEEYPNIPRTIINNLVKICETTQEFLKSNKEDLKIEKEPLDHLENTETQLKISNNNQKKEPYSTSELASKDPQEKKSLKNEPISPKSKTSIQEKPYFFHQDPQKNPDIEIKTSEVDLQPPPIPTIFSEPIKTSILSDQVNLSESIYYNNEDIIKGSVESIVSSFKSSTDSNICQTSGYNCESEFELYKSSTIIIPLKNPDQGNKNFKSVEGESQSIESSEFCLLASSVISYGNELKNITKLEEIQSESEDDFELI